MWLCLYSQGTKAIKMLTHGIIKRDHGVTDLVDIKLLRKCLVHTKTGLWSVNKRFDMFVLPGKDHGVMCPYYQNLIRYYFVENLLQPTERHIDIVNHSY